MLMIFMSMIESPEDRSSFEEIYRLYSDMLYRYAYRILQDTASSEDAVHDAFLSLARNFEKYQHLDRNQTRNLLIIIVRNAAFRIYNHRKRETAVEEVYADKVLPDISEGAEQRDIKQIVFQLIRSMDSKYGDVIMLKYYCDLSVNEIAEQLQLTADNVKVRLHRGRALLKSKLEEAGILEG